MKNKTKRTLGWSLILTPFIVGLVYGIQYHPEATMCFAGILIPSIMITYGAILLELK